MSNAETEQAEEGKEQRKKLLEQWSNKASKIVLVAAQLVHECRQVRDELATIVPSVIRYGHTVRIWRAKATTVRELENRTSAISDVLIQLQGEWSTLPLTMGNVLAMQNDLALIRETRLQMLVDMMSLKSDLTNIQQVLTGTLANVLGWLSVSLGLLSVVLAIAMLL